MRQNSKQINLPSWRAGAPPPLESITCPHWLRLRLQVMVEQHHTFEEEFRKQTRMFEERIKRLECANLDK